MKALTIRQPFAAAIMAGVKTIEYRSWRTPYRGPLAIHAAKRLAPADWRAEWPELDADTMIYGAILGAVEMIDCVASDSSFEWILTNPQPLRRPFMCGGQLGLWVTPPAAAKLLARNEAVMFTSNFARLHDLPADLRAVSIARWPPRTWGKRPRYMPLAPPIDLLKAIKSGSVTWGEYCDRYNAMLAKLSPKTVAAELEGAALLCFCPPGHACHRRLAAEWIEEKLDIDVCEWPYERDLILPAIESPMDGVTPIDKMPWRVRCDHCKKDQAVSLTETERMGVKCSKPFTISWTD